MIQCKILVTGPYSDYQGSGHNRIAVVHSVGDIVSFPNEYAKMLEKSNMAECLVKEIIKIDEEDVLPVNVPVRATESAIELAAAFQIDLATITGTGDSGRVILSDVKKVVEMQDKVDES